MRAGHQGFLNLLARINRELDGTFELAAFEHRAFFNEAAGRIEMHLVSRRTQRARVAGRTIGFERGESIHTESSYKYGIDEFGKLAGAAGFATEQVRTDRDRLFSGVRPQHDAYSRNIL